MTVRYWVHVYDPSACNLTRARPHGLYDQYITRLTDTWRRRHVVEKPASYRKDMS